MKEDFSQYTESQNEKAKIASALAHPARIAILQYIIDNGGCCFTNINHILPLAKSTTSRHIKELLDVGLIISDDNAARPKYCINKEMTAQARNLFALVLNCNCTNKENYEEKQE